MRVLFLAGVTLVALCAVGWLVLPMPHAAPTWRWSERPWFCNGDPEYRGLRSAWMSAWPAWSGRSLTVFYDIERNVLCCVCDPIGERQPSVSSDGRSTWFETRGINHRFLCDAHDEVVLIRFQQDSSQRLILPAVPRILAAQFSPECCSPRHPIEDIDDEEIVQRITGLCVPECAESVRRFCQ